MVWFTIRTIVETSVIKRTKPLRSPINFLRQIQSPNKTPNKQNAQQKKNTNGREPCGRGWGSGGTRFKNFLCERKILVAFFKISLYNYIIEIELGGAIRWVQIPQILKIYQ